MKPTAAALLALASRALAAERLVAPAGCATVAPTGGDFTSVQAAVNATVIGGCIFLAAGTYEEQVYVTTPGLTIYGYTTDDTGYAGNGATIVNGFSQDLGLNNDGTGTLRVHAADFKLYNVIVKNSRGEGSQAIALSAYNTAGYYGCSFQGYQDTILTNELQQIYVKSEIVGVTDFIFGQRSFAWFEDCDIRVLNATQGYVTANGASAADTSKYVFNNCDVAAKEGETMWSTGIYYLGRPWRAYSYTVFQNSTMSNVINPSGWSIWSAGDERTVNTTYAEYGNSGDGAVGPRATWTKTLDAPIDITEILGADYATQIWYDAAYMA